MEFSAADAAFLTSPAGREAIALAAGLPLAQATLITDIGRLRTECGERAAAVVELVRCRRRAVGKLTDPQSWLLTDEPLQQATASVVAEHRARRLAGLSVHDVTCSIGAELRQLISVCPRVVGSDLDPGRARLAAINNPGAAVLVADALAPVSTADVVIADPGRRAGGRRTFDPEQMAPPLSALRAVYAGRSLAIKTAPGIDHEGLRRDGFEGEVEVTSFGGGVKEACLWSGPVAVPGLTRATVLRADGGFEITSATSDDVDVADAGKYLIEPDGAVIRAGLVRHWAARHGLWQLDERIAYVTGDAVPRGERGFEVLDQLKFTEKSLRAQLRARRVGAVEILTRGAGVDPDVLRRRLKLEGDESMTVVITRIERTVTAFLCRPTR